MLTPAQETFLADFADKGIEEIQAAVQRNIDLKKEEEDRIAREEFLTNLKAEKEQEIATALAEFDSKNK